MLRIDHAISNQVPDLKKSLDEMGSKIEKAAAQQGSDLQSHASDERQLRERMMVNIKALQSHVIALKGRVEGKVKPDDIKDLVRNVHDVSVAEADTLSGVTSVSGAPQTYSSISSAMSGVNAPEWGRPDYSKLHAFKGAGLPVEKSLALLMMAKNARWEATNTSLNVSYDGGSATFAAKPSSKFEDLQRQAQVFNSVADAVKAVGGEGLQYQPYIRKPPTTPGTVPMPQHRAPNIPGVTGPEALPIVPPAAPQDRFK